MNREQRRWAERIESRTKSGRRKQPHQDSTAFNPVIGAIVEADYRTKFNGLKRAAEVQCLASDDTVQIAGDAGFLLFITLRALELEQYELQDLDVIEALAVMGTVLAEINEAHAIDSDQRNALVTGMNYLDALVQALSKETISIAWYQVESAALRGDIGTQSLNALLLRLNETKT